MLGDSYAARDQSDRSTWRGENSPWGATHAAPEGGTFDFAEYWRLVVKHRVLVGGALLAALTVGIAITFLTTPTYTAATTLQIDREAARVLAVDDVSPRESMIQGEEFFQTQYGILRSRSVAERVIDDLGLATSDAFLDQMGVRLPRSEQDTAAKRLQDRRDATIETLHENLGVSPVRGSRLVTVTFDSPDPVLSARLANAFAENFIQGNLDRKFDSSKYAREFLEERIAQTKTDLEEAERQLVAYAINQQIINVTEAGSASGEARALITGDLVALSSALSEVRAERIAAEEKWRQARGARLMSLPEVLQNPIVQRLSEERARLSGEFQQKSQVYQPDFPEMVQLQARLDEIDQQISSVASGIRTSLQGQYTVALNQERSLQNRVNGLKNEVLDQRGRSVQYNILQRELDTSRTLYDGLLQRYKEVGVTGGVTANNISIIDEAEPPQKPSKPRLFLNLAIAALAGLGLGVMAAFVIEALDESIRGPDDVESKLGLPVLGTVPLLPKGQSAVQALDDARSPISEAYYSLRTALQFSTPDGAPATILVTSSRPAEGKSTTAFAIAANLARIGKRVLLIDCDLRNPSMHRTIGTDNERGMSNLMSGDGDFATLAQKTSSKNLLFIPCGPLPPNPGELWGSDRLTRLLEQARSDFDHVVLDGPPVLGFADAPLLSSAVAGTLFALESRVTRRAQARGAIRRLLMGNGRILGVVLTKFDTNAAQYGGYDYAYDYSYGGTSDGSTSRPRGRKR